MQQHSPFVCAYAQARLRHTWSRTRYQYLVLGLTLCGSACSANMSAADGGTTRSTTPSGSAGSTAGNAAQAGEHATTAAGAFAPQGGGSAAGAFASQGGGSATAGLAAGAQAATAGVPGANAGMAGGMPLPNKMCFGQAAPPRAQGTQPPYAIGPEPAGLPAYWPTDAWRPLDPAKLGFDATKLSKAVDFNTSYSSTQAVFVVRHGYVAAEKYFGNFSAATTHESYSMAKSFASGLVGIAIAEGKLKSTMDEKICEYYPMQWDCSATSDPRSRITLDHAMNLTTGLMWQENWRSTYRGVNDAYNLNLLDTVLSRTSAEEPGKTKRYSTGDPALLSGVLQKVTGMTAYDYGKQKIFDVIGAKSIRWNLDTAGRTTTYAGLQATAADYARYGYLYLQRGNWDGKQVVPSDWIEHTTQGMQPCEDWNQYLWHINPPVRLGPQEPSCTDFYCKPTALADLPPEAYFAEGVNGQFIFIVPSSDLVAVRLASDQSGSEHWDEFALGFLSALLDAIQ
jgi:CubicO group peptidase (beta-lactamase class C family)